jgi:ketosteroid isomerase-like protein
VTEAEFATYLAALNRGDFAAAGAALSDDVVLNLRSGTAMGRQAAVDLLSSLAERLETRLRADMVIADSEALFADLAVEFDCVADAPDHAIAPMRAGQGLKGRLFTLHRLDGEGRIREIKTAVYGAWDPPD